MDCGLVEMKNNNLNNLRQSTNFFHLWSSPDECDVTDSGWNCEFAAFCNSFALTLTTSLHDNFGFIPLGHGYHLYHLYILMMMSSKRKKQQNIKYPYKVLYVIVKQRMTRFNLNYCKEISRFIRKHLLIIEHT